MAPTPDSGVLPPATVARLVHDQRSGERSVDHRAFLDRFVDVSSFERIVAVCLERSGEAMLSQWEALISNGLDDIGIIDVGRRVRSTQAASGASSSNVIHGVGATDDPGAVIEALNSYLSPLDHSNGRILCLVDSLTPYITHLSPDATVGFVEEFAYLVRAAGGQGWVWLDGQSDEWVRRTLSPPFDRVLSWADDEVSVLTGDPPDHRFSPDRAYSVLTPRRRRYLLHLLALSQPPSLPLDHVVTQIARWDDEASSERRVRLRLLHTDFPKLERLNLIKYDATEQRIEPREGLDAVRSELRRTAPYDFGDDGVDRSPRQNAL